MRKSELKSMTIAEASDYFDDHDIFEFENTREVTDIKLHLSPFGRTLKIFNITQVTTAETLQFGHAVF